MSEGGVTAKLRGSLEGYLARSAVELDERGAVLAERAAELDAQAADLERLEEALRERRRRIDDLTPLQEDLERSFDALLAGLENRAGTAAGRAEELGRRIQRLGAGEAELAERERLFTEKSDRVRVEQGRLAERERDLARFHRELLDPEAAEATQWVARRDRSFAEAEQDLRERAGALEQREKELEARQLQVGVDLRLRKEELERRERELSALSERLARRESELSAYVAQLQGSLDRRRSA